jgi:hypothetical protein
MGPETTTRNVLRVAQTTDKLNSSVPTLSLIVHLKQAFSHRMGLVSSTRTFLSLCGYTIPRVHPNPLQKLWLVSDSFSPCSESIMQASPGTVWDQKLWRLNAHIATVSCALYKPKAFNQLYQLKLE